MKTTATIPFRRGEKIRRDLGETVDVGTLRIMLMHASPPADEVMLQEGYTGYAQCPWCGHVGWASGLNVTRPVDIVCGHCGRYFRA
ncbi:hypothetical protein [Zavarzinia compransoris]|uniref:Uncharacterized protein n=1 Tax=Zavarzinia compransoris TaxID=1264899 RepID=A0A317EE69_9PROT|nr:hypothetical protein [Zavarzinia compransoris]PWR23515.1 hypothetical protein DKG75_02785 [Zavarzinia compransoris]TDP47726.1 hypothetical protein DES42_10218 [Zavarzinia compransoris]